MVESVEKIRRWLAERPTPLLWICGPASSGKTTAVQASVLGVAHATLLISAFGLDDAYANTENGRQGEVLTMKLLLRLVADKRIVILDGLEASQQAVGKRTGDITDCRIRQLLLTACYQPFAGVALIVTSRIAPPNLLPEGAITVINQCAATNVQPPSLPASDSIERRVMEFAALTPGAFRPVALEHISGIEEPINRQVLNSAMNERLVLHVGQDTYQFPDWLRSLILAEPIRIREVRKLAIDALSQNGRDPQRLLGLLLDEGNVGEAVMVYWNALGNFSRLHHEGRDHLGAELCRRLNGGLGPEEISTNLRTSEGAWAVMNDWSQFALCCGDVEISALAAMSAYEVLPDDKPLWDRAILAAHAAQSHILTGKLRTTMEWCERSWAHAREGMRKTQGIATREIMEAYDWSANTLAKIYLRLEQPLEVRQLIEDLTVVHQYARQSILEFNATSIIPVGGPSGEVTPDQLVDGRLAAILALAEHRYGDVSQFTAEKAEASDRINLELRTMLLRAEMRAVPLEGADALFMEMRNSAEQRDDCATECELAVIAQLRITDSGEQLALLGAYLPRAEACGLGMHWRDLQLARSRALRDSGLNNEARHAAKAALYGTAKIAGAHLDADWPAAREAVSLLQSVGETVPDDVLTAARESRLPERRSPSKPIARRKPASIKQGSSGREELHAAATSVLERYQNEGLPFALSFRKFGLEVLHGPFELGPKLIENALRDALPAEIEVLTIQNHQGLEYDLSSSRMKREAPALLLEDEHWREVASALILAADLIVSEPTFLSEGVRYELQTIYDTHRWDRTVLVLPPQQSIFPLIDNDPLIQMFPRCIWADLLHEKSLSDFPIVADLLQRMRAIADLPLETRRGLNGASERDKAYPIDLVHVAEYFETEVQIGSFFQQDSQAKRYYAFWQMMRASGIRGVKYQQGDKSTSNRCKLARSYIEMSKIMVDYTEEGDRFILHGDPAEAQILIGSAYGLLNGIDDDISVQLLRAEAENRWDKLMKLEKAVKDNAHRFTIRPTYGPLVKAKLKG